MKSVEGRIQDLSLHADSVWGRRISIFAAELTQNISGIKYNLTVVAASKQFASQVVRENAFRILRHIYSENAKS